jgi:hypothetical protein
VETDLGGRGSYSHWFSVEPKYLAKGCFQRLISNSALTIFDKKKKKKIKKLSKGCLQKKPVTIKCDLCKTQITIMFYKWLVSG